MRDHVKDDTAPTTVTHVGLAVLVCTRNRPDQLAECLESIRQSDLVTQIIVSTDGVDGPTDDVLRSVSECEERLTWVRGPRLGLAANRNAAVAAVTEPFIVFLDDDARLSTDFVAAALPRANASLLVTGWEMRDGERVTPHNPDFLGFQRMAPTGPLRSIVMNATVFPTAFLRRVPFDEWYQYGSEEVDIATAACATGLTIEFIDAGNVHLHSELARDGNTTKALRSRAHFSMQRYRRYEPNRGRAIWFCVVGSLNAIGHGLKNGGAKGALGAARHFFAGLVTPVRPMSFDDGVASSEANDVGSKATLVPSVDVVVPTLRRPLDLATCLGGLFSQEVVPRQVIVVRRPDDAESAQVLSESPHRVTEVVVNETGTVAALSAGAKASTADVVAFIDDDAVPRTDWLARIIEHYGDPSVVAVGGRDVIHPPSGLDDGRLLTVGMLTRTGRLIGNHHLGSGRPRAVDVLKGCNCSFRRQWLAFPSGLKGSGAEVGHDLATSLFAGGHGTIVYDPNVLVDHYPGVRVLSVERSDQSRRAIFEQTYNTTYAIASLRPHLRLRRLAYMVVVGTRASPSVVRLLYAVLRRERDVSRHLRTVMKAQIAATLDAWRHPLVMTPTIGGPKGVSSNDAAQPDRGRSDRQGGATTSVGDPA
jgi:glycosyltransferase involved in cell wall biosynthesis